MNFEDWLKDLQIGIQPRSIIDWEEADDIKNY